MTMPGNIGGAVPDGPDWLVRAVRDLQRQLAALRTATPAASVKPQIVSAVGQNFDLTSTGFDTLQASATLQFPAGWRACVLSLAFALGAWNSRTAADTLVGRIVVQSGGAWSTFDEVSPSNYGSVTAVDSTVVYRDENAEAVLTSAGWPITSLYADADGSILVGGNGYTGGGTWTHIASPTNLANLSGTALFIR